MSKLITLKQENFEQVISSGKVLVDFWAAWCGPCRMLSPVVDEVAEEVSTAVAKCNIDENPALAEKYNINVIPTLVVLENGKEVARSVGVVSKQKILDLVK